jgi:hypothetical protein
MLTDSLLRVENLNAMENFLEFEDTTGRAVRDDAKRDCWMITKEMIDRLLDVLEQRGFDRDEIEITVRKDDIVVELPVPCAGAVGPGSVAAPLTNRDVGRLRRDGEA